MLQSISVSEESKSQNLFQENLANFGAQIDPFSYNPRRCGRRVFHISKVDKLNPTLQKEAQDEISLLEQEYKMILAMNQLKRIK